MISITVVGKLYRDSEIKTGGNGDYLTFSVGVRDAYGDLGRMMYFDVNTNQTGLSDFLKATKEVAVSGELKSREHDGKIYLSIRKPSIKLIGGNEELTKPPKGDAVMTPPQGEPPSDPNNGMDDEIPF